jgi:hypothetical protein
MLHISSAVGKTATYDQLLVQQTLCPNSSVLPFYLDDEISIGNSTGTTNFIV